MTEEIISIKDLLDGNGNPFNVQQAYSFKVDKWRYSMTGVCPLIKACVEENKDFSDARWLKELRLLNTMYRVRSIMSSMRDGTKLTSIGVIRKDGKLYLKDGRHRCWASILLGNDKIKAQIVDR